VSSGRNQKGFAALAGRTKPAKIIASTDTIIASSIQPELAMSLE